MTMLLERLREEVLEANLELVRRGLARSRGQAAELIDAGRVAICRIIGPRSP